jgi:hypothetical protein
MTNKVIDGECITCESTYTVEYATPLVSQPLPEFCPFCGDPIEDISEQYIEDDDLNDDDFKWE